MHQVRIRPESGQNVGSSGEALSLPWKWIAARSEKSMNTSLIKCFDGRNLLCSSVCIVIITVKLLQLKLSDPGDGQREQRSLFTALE